MHSLTAWEISERDLIRITRNGSNVIFRCSHVEKLEDQCKVIVWGYDMYGSVRYELGASEHVIRVE